MLAILVFALLVAGFVLFLLATFIADPEPWPRRLRFVSAGLACWILTDILTHFPEFRF